MHEQCPQGKNSWCFFQRELTHKLQISEKYVRLPNDVLNAVKPAYLELCSRELLMKCLYGKTQTAIESLNGVIWQMLPKKVFVCLKKMKFGAYNAVIQFNDGFQGV